MDELVGLLTREKLLLERLLFRCTELRMMLGSDARFVAWASYDLSNAADALRDAELRRVVLYTALADSQGWPGDQFDWDRIIEHAGEPHATILVEIRDSLAGLTAELHAQLAAVRQMGEAGLAGVTEFLERLGGPEELVRAAVSPSAGSSRWQPSTSAPRVDRKL